MAAAVDPTVAAVGPRVKALREAMDLSLRDLAERSGVSAPMLSQVERGETSPTLAVAGRIAAGLELSRHELMAGAATGREGDPPRHEPGSREIALVTQGTVVLHIDGARHELHE